MKGGQVHVLYCHSR